MKNTGTVIMSRQITGGMSPAQVYRCRLSDGTECYLKKIGQEFASTTYSVQREAAVMQWLAPRLHVPEVIEHGVKDGTEYLLMSALPGQYIDTLEQNPQRYITALAEALRQLWSVDITDCPFRVGLNVRLQELRYLLNSGLADTDPAHWDPSTEFSDPHALFDWLCRNRPEEDAVFTHGDLCGNLFLHEDRILFCDLARCGIADRWTDIALCVREIRDRWQDSIWEDLFFRQIGVKKDESKLRYYMLLDEMF